jgi:NAD(P)-dependent dehydrogenase (short-subunit alcohol dehydrogenase family)
MQFSENEIERFVAWSGDHNPVYVDREFAQEGGHRQPLVPGVLAVFGAFASVSGSAQGPPATLDIQLQGAIVPDAACDVAWARGPDEFCLSVRQGGAEIISIAGGWGGDSGAAPRLDLSWFKRLESDRMSQERGKRSEPNDRNLEELHSGFAVSGVYATDPPPELATSSGCLTAVQARVLGLCGYLVGMEAPGLRSTFSRARLHFTNLHADSNQLWYRARTIRFDESARVLDTEIEVATPDGQLLATGELQSAVRFNVPATNLTALAARLHPDVQCLTGKVALVCGGSRGVGADLTAALALAGCKVYVGFQKSAAAAGQLARRLAERKAAIELLQGDAGDPLWCSTALETIQNRHGRLDILVLNAGAAPPVFRISPQSAPDFDAYLRSNLRLAWMPLATFLPILEENSGMVACISSTLASDPQPGFSHEVALKRAVEGIVETATRESPHLWSLIIRPQRTFAAWSGATAGLAAATAAEVVSARIVNRLAGPWCSGEVEWLGDNSAVAAPQPIGEQTAENSELEEEIDTWFEPSLTEGLDADSILVSMDALIAAELVAPRALVGEPDRLHGREDDCHSIPTLAEIDHWHEEPAGSSNDLPKEEFPTFVVEPEAHSGSSQAESVPADIQHETTPEGHLHELLNELHSEIVDAVGTDVPAQTELDQEAEVSDLSPAADMDLSDTHPMLDIVCDGPADEAVIVDESDLQRDECSHEPVEPTDADVPGALTEKCDPVSAPVSSAPANSAGSDDRPPVSEPSAVPETQLSLAPVVAADLVVSETQTPRVSYEIAEYEAGTSDEIARWEERIAPGGNAGQWLDKWKWRHVESAGHLVRGPRVWAYREAGEVLGWFGAIPLKLKIGLEEQMTSWITWQTPADADRDQKIAQRLLVRAADEFPFSLSLARTEQTRSLLKQSGWVEVAQLESAELMLNPDAILQVKHPGTATLGEWGWRAATAVRTLLRHRARVNIQPIGRFEERHDRLWQFAAREVSCGVVRDAARLNWKYVDQPAQDILRLEVIDGSRLLGVVILTFREADETRPYRHAVLSDVLAPLADAESLSKLFEVASAAAAERNADAVLCEHSGQSLTRALRQNGFVIGRSGRYLFVNPGQLTPEVGSKVVAAHEWLLTAGDVDL